MSASAEPEPDSGGYQFTLCTATGAVCDQAADLWKAAHAAASSNPGEGLDGFLAQAAQLQPSEDGVWTLQREVVETAFVVPGSAASAASYEPSGPAVPLLVAAPDAADLAKIEAALPSPFAAAEPLRAAVDALPVDPRGEAATLLDALGTIRLPSLLSPDAPATAAPPRALTLATSEALPGEPPQASRERPVPGAVESLQRDALMPAQSDAVAGDTRPEQPALTPLALFLAPFDLPFFDAFLAIVGLFTAILLAPPLYHRLQQQKLLDHEGRARLYRLVGERPGIHIEELARMTGGSRSTVVYHLRLLSRHGFVVAMGSRKSVHYYPNNAALDTTDRERRALLTAPRTRALAARIAAEPGIQRAELAKKEGISVSTLSWHLGRLLRVALVEDRLGFDGRALHPSPQLAGLLEPWADSAQAAPVAATRDVQVMALPPAV